MFVETKPEGEAAVKLGLADFIGWLETKDPLGTYDYMHCGGACLVGQYLAARGIPWVSGKTMKTDLYRECAGTQANGFAFIAAEYPTTFGAALERARATLSTDYQ